MLRFALFVARKDVQYALRGKETWLWTFIMPIVFFYFIGTATGGFGGAGSSDKPDALAVTASPEPGFLEGQLMRRLEERNFRIVLPATPEERAGYRRRIEIPSDLTESVLAGETATLRFEREGEGPAADYDKLRVQRAMYTVLADVIAAAAGDEGGQITPESLQRLDEAPRNLTLDVKSAGKRKRIPTGFEQTIPGTLVMFTILVLLTGGSIPLLVERREGILRRLASAPVSRGSIVLGKWLGKMALALVQVAFAMLAGTVIFGMHWGPSLAMVCVVLAAWAGLNASLSLFLGNLAKSEGQAVGIGVLSANVLAALGGCWWPIEVTPDWMQRLALFLPTGWAMDALHRLISFGEGAGAALPHVLGIGAAALVTGWLATRTFRFQ